MKGNQTFKTIVISLISGIIGAVLILGGFLMVSGYSFGEFIHNAPAETKGNAGSAQIVNKTVTETTPATKAFEKVNKAVVSVVNLKEESSNENSLDSILGGLYGNDSDSSSAKNKSRGKSSDSDLEEYGEGSGLIYSSKNGKAYVVTNNHVVVGSDSLEVILSDGHKEKGKLVGSDAITDLAVVEIPNSKVTTVGEFADSNALKPGQQAIAIGSPLGKNYATSVTEGIVSATNRQINVPDSSGKFIQQSSVIQTDAAINPGNSGGPLVNVDGQVIGINSMKLAQSTDGTSVEGMGFAIPSNEVVSIINELVAHGKITRPALGVSVVNITDVPINQAALLKIPNNLDSGVIIAKVQAGSAASKAGLKQYDVITKFDDKKITDVNELHTYLYKKKVGDKVKVTFIRDGKTETLEVTLK